MTYLIIQMTGIDTVVARFARRGKGLIFLQGARRPIPEPGGYRELLSGFDTPEGSEKVILSMPPATVHARRLTLPMGDRKRLREILPLELAGEIAAAAEDASFDALPLGGDSHLALWCRHADISPVIAELASAGLEPEIVTAAHLHWNLLLPPEEDAPCIVTDGTALMIGTGSGPLLVRPLPAEEGEREIARTMTAFDITHGQPVAGTLRLGENAADGAVQPSTALLESFAGERVAALDLAGAWAVAQAAVTGTIVNFRSGTLAYTAGNLKTVRRLRLTAALAATLVLLLFFETGVRYYLLRRDVNSLDAAIGAKYREIFPNRQAPRDAVGEVRSEIKRLSGGTSSRKLLPALRLLAGVKGEEVTGFYEAELDGMQINLKGDAKSVNEFKSRAAAALATAELSEIKSKTDGSVSFVFRGSVKEGN